MRRTLARENFTSARRRRPISFSMLKVPNISLERSAAKNQVKSIVNSVEGYDEEKTVYGRLSEFIRIQHSASSNTQQETI